MSIIDEIKKDHEKVKTLMEQLEKGLHSKKGSATSQKTFDKIANELDIHTKAEEDTFYPALQKFEEAKEKVMEAYEEHHVARLLLGEMKQLSPGDDHFAAKFSVLQENVLHHMKEEEGPIFKICREVFGKSELTQIGEEFVQDKKQIMQTA